MTVCQICGGDDPDGHAIDCEHYEGPDPRVEHARGYRRAIKDMLQFMSYGNLVSRVHYDCDEEALKFVLDSVRKKLIEHLEETKGGKAAAAALKDEEESE